MPRGFWPVLYTLLAAASGAGAAAAEDAVDFHRDIRPILSGACFQCHGPDEKQRKADLRLDTKAGAFEDRGGHFVIVAGKPEASRLMQRITAQDPKKRMPPAKSGKSLSPKQVELIRRWIRQGAKWSEHWAF